MARGVKAQSETTMAGRSMKSGELRPLTIDGITDWVTVLAMGKGDQVFVQFRSGSRLSVQASLLGDLPYTYRSNDRDTARQAGERVNFTEGQRKVFLALAGAGSRGLIDHDHERLNGLIPTSAGKRRLELTQLGLVGDSGHRRATATGTAAIVWTLTDAGRQVARTMRGAA
jgi:hypothetical protein